MDVAGRDAAGDIIVIYDYKTGNAELAAARTAQIRSQLPWDARNVPIIVITER